jgi:hypothetical protein
MEKKMTDKSKLESPNILARIAAVLFLFVVVMGITIELVSLGDILIPADANATINNLVTSETAFRAAIFGYLVRQIILILLVLTIYKLFKPVDKTAAGVMLVFALLSSGISMLNELNYFAAVHLVTNTATFSALGAGAEQDLVIFFIDLHQFGTMIPAILSLWISLLGYLAIKSGFVPKILGIGLMISGVAWVALALPLVFPDFDPTMFGLVAILGEAIFYLWLLIRGVKTA